MKTNFENAVKILMEGRCESIRPEGDDGAMILRDDGSVSEVLEWKRGFGETSIPCAYVINRWECLGYKPEMETVPVDRMVLVERETGRIIKDITDDPAYCRDGRYRETIISIEVKRPVKEKIKYREEISRPREFMSPEYNTYFPEKTKFYAEW